MQIEDIREIDSLTIYWQDWQIGHELAPMKKHIINMGDLDFSSRLRVEFIIWSMADINQPKMRSGSHSPHYCAIEITRGDNTSLLFEKGAFGIKRHTTITPQQVGQLYDVCLK